GRRWGWWAHARARTLGAARDAARRARKRRATNRQARNRQATNGQATNGQATSGRCAWRGGGSRFGLVERFVHLRGELLHGVLDRGATREDFADVLAARSSDHRVAHTHRHTGLADFDVLE